MVTEPETPPGPSSSLSFLFLLQQTQSDEFRLKRPVLVCRKQKLIQTSCLVAPPPPKRAPSTSLTLRSKSMTADLEEIGKTNATLRQAVESNSCFILPVSAPPAARRRRYGELDRSVVVLVLLA